MAMRIPFDWNTIAMADSLLLESGPYLSGASYLAMMIRKEKKRKHVSLSLSLTNEVEPDNASNRTLHPPSLINPREKKLRNTKHGRKIPREAPLFPSNHRYYAPLHVVQRRTMGACTSFDGKADELARRIR